MMPSKTMERGEMDLGEAIKALKEGKRVSRAVWNGKGMWLAYSPGSKVLPAANFWSPCNKAFPEQNGGTAEVLRCITMKTADGKILMGWLASQTDILSDDWDVAS
jgi:hypothetical protein